MTEETVKNTSNETKEILNAETLGEIISEVSIQVCERLSEQLKLNGNEPKATSEFYSGAPKEEDLQKINSYFGGQQTNVEDWFVCCVRASDNLVHRSDEKWSVKVLEHMRDRGNGTNFLINHDWGDIRSSIGFIFDGLLREENPVRQRIGKEKYNERIINKEGYIAYYAWVAIPTTEESVSAIKQRRAQFISTGGLVDNIRLVCPICTEEKGEDVGVWDMNDNGKYICPHSLPGWGWWDGSEDMEMPYVVVDGDYDPVEISLVTSGNLPAAEIVR